MKSDFMQRMKETMQEKGIRQTDLVEKTGIDKGALSSYMNGRYMPNAEKVAKIGFDESPDHGRGHRTREEAGKRGRR